MKSFLFELKGKGEVIFNVVRKGDYRIEDDVITFYFEDTFVNRNKAPEIKEFFEMILKERFSIDAKVGFDFSKTIDRSLKMESDYRLQQEIHTIVEHADIVEKEQKEEKKATITGIYISYAYSPMHLVVNRKLFVSVSPASKVII